jgi:hypothetical protein
MKKLMICLTAALAVMMLNTSCSSSDDYDYEKFVTNLVAHNWEGHHTSQYREFGSWIDNGTEYVAMKFTRTGTQLSGTGTQIIFENSYKTKETDRSDFKWYISGERIYIEYVKGWSTVDEKCVDCTINDTNFKGFWHNTKDAERRFKFDYIPLAEVNF